jgi:hypothetical protein
MLLLIPLALAVLLAGCVSTGLTATASKTVCRSWVPITYSGRNDTGLTKRQIRVHNRTGQNLGCWT